MIKRTYFWYKLVRLFKTTQDEEIRNAVFIVMENMHLMFGVRNED